MVTLEMVLDPSGIRRGAAEAERELQRVGSAARQAAASVDGIYTTIGSKADTAARSVGNLSNAFQSVGGSLQVGQGITQTLAALERADVAGAGTNVARTLLEISKTGADFRQLAAGVGATGNAFATLRAIMVAHPILTIATAIGLASAAIGLFSSNTKEAVSEVAKLAQGLDRVRAAQSIAADFGDRDYLARGRQDEIRALREAAIDIRSGRRTATAGDLGELFGPGVDLRDVLEQANALDAPSAEGLSGAGRVLEQYRILGSGANSPDRRVSTATSVELIRRRILALESEGRLNQPLPLTAEQQAYERAIAAYQRGAPQPNLDAIGAPAPKYGPTDNEAEIQQARLEALDEQMRELRDIGAQVGATFASAFESVVSGANSARDAVAGLAKSLGSSVLQQVFRNLGANIAGSFARDGGPSATVRTPGVN